MDRQESFVLLMDRLRSGEDAAAAEVFRRFAHRLILLARAKLQPALRSKVDPEDVAQSVFRSFFGRQREGDFDVSTWDSLWSLLAVITVRKCANKKKFFGRDRRAAHRESTPQADAADSILSAEVLSREPTPDQAAELTETLESLMRKLDERERQILTLVLQGLSVAEVGSTVGCAERTVRRAMTHIRKLLMQEGQVVMTSIPASPEP